YEDKPMQTIEMEHFGFDHAYTARVIMKTWQLPPSLVFVASRHHRPRVENKMKRSVACVHVADVLTHAYSITDMTRANVPKIDRQVWQSLGLAGTLVEDIRAEALEQLKDLCHILEIE
ncbi:MAG: HDOD domain-containing protein, partial [Planctomycetota bacterium]